MDTIETPVVEPVVKVSVVEPVVETAKKVKAKRKKRVVDPNAPKKERKPNAWLIHVKQYRLDHPEVPYKQILKDAKTTYKK